MVQDQRLVQTAVAGSAGSDVPVMLPVSVGDVDRLLEQRPGQTYWCGQLLGGCGARLIIRRSTVRVCHFAHVPGTGWGPCRRAVVGVDGADHLYIRQQVLEWLAAQDVRAVARMPESGRLGGEVLFDPGAARGCLRVLLDQEAAAPPVAEGGLTVLGPGVAHDPHQMTVHGYVLRVRCETDGARRRVLIGTQVYGHTTWESLEECRLASWGISTPAALEVRRLRGTRRPIGGPACRTPPPVAARPVAAVQAEDDREAAFAALRRAVDDGQGVSALRHCLTIAEATTHGGATAAETGLLRAATERLLLLERGVGASTDQPPRTRRAARKKVAAARASAPRKVRAGSRQAAQSVSQLLDALNRRHGHLGHAEQQHLVAKLDSKAQEAGGWLTDAQRRAVENWKRRPLPAERPTGEHAKAPTSPAGAHRAQPGRQRPRQEATAPVTVPVGVEVAAAAARDVLEHAARLGKTVAFSRLCAEVRGLTALSEEQQRQVFKDVSAGSPVALAALITTDDGHAHPYYQQVVGAGSGLKGVWRTAVAKVHEHYRPRR